MLIPKAYIEKDVNKVCEYYHPDTPDSSYVKDDLEKYYSYPKFEYRFNERGLRDDPWPSTVEELRKGIFVVGDSGSVGVGIPYEYVWTKVVEDYYKLRVYKIGTVEACNVNFIFANVRDILETIKPKVIIIQWSFAWRNNLKRKIFSWNPDKQDNELLVNLVKRVEQLKGDTNILHCFVEENLTRQFFKMIKDVPMDKTHLTELDIVDMARDNLHYGIKTNRNFAQHFIDYVQEKNINLR